MSSKLNTSVDSEMHVSDKRQNKDKFSSTCSTYITLLGYSVGQSDYWRFAFLAYRNGGGAFLIPYLLVIIMCGIPLYFLEYSAAKFSGKGPYGIWDVSPLFRGIGISICCAYGLYIVGNSIMRCWMLDFLFNSFQDPLPWTHCNQIWNTESCRDIVQMSYGNVSYDNTSIPTNAIDFTINSINVTLSEYSSNFTLSGYDTLLPMNVSSTPMSSAEEFWQYKVLELSSGILDLQPIQWRYVVETFAFRVIVLLCLIKSIKSIEKVMYVTTLVPIILSVIIFIRSLMLPGSGDGVYLFFYPEFSKLLEPRVWIESALMAFYTLAFGWGALIMLGSHAKFRDNGVRTSILLPVLDTIMAMFSGLVGFSILGNMAHVYNIPIQEVISAGMSTGIIAYVTALSSLPVPQIWSVMFFSSAIITSIDSQMIPLEMILQVIGEIYPKLFPRYRIHTLALLSLCIFIVALPTCTGAGAYLFLWNDWYTGAWVGPIVAFVELVVFAWTYGIDRFSNDIAIMVGRPIPAMFRVFIAFVAPLIVLGIIITSCMEYVAPKYGSYTYPSWARYAGWITVVVMLLPMPLHAVFALLRDKGSLVKRLKRHIKPNKHWGPCDDEERSEYPEKCAKYKNRSMKDIFFYSIFGSYRTDSNKTQFALHEREMTLLEKESRNHKC